MKQILKTIGSWANFEKAAERLNPRQKGQLFELLTKYYLLLSPLYRTKLSDVWLLSEVPPAVRTALNLPLPDNGIDIIARTNGNRYWAVQCKYRSARDHSLTWREISTFTGLTFGICKGIEFGLIAHTGERYTHVLKDAVNVGLLSSDVWNSLEADFFSRLSDAIEDKSQPLRASLPRLHQTRAVDKAVAYFNDSKNRRGKLIMPCGAGKSLTAFWIARALSAKTIVVAVPSLGLIQQTLPVWLREYVATNESGGLRWLCICSDETVAAQDEDGSIVHTQDLGYPCLTDRCAIESWFQETEIATYRLIFTTYQSGKTLSNALRASGIEVDLGIMDEAHKTAGDRNRLFSHLLFDANLPIKRRVFMTATERRFAGQSDNIVSMDDAAVYGDTFELLSFKDALEQQPPILSDYKIITMVISHQEIAQLVAQNRYLRPDGIAWNEEVEAQMLAALVALRQAMAKYPISHAVSFHRSIRRADAFRQFNDIYTASMDHAGPLDTFHVTGMTPSVERKRLLAAFSTSSRSLVTNARCLTEGIDIPNIDCVLFADPKQSTVDIVQAVGRALRPAAGKRFGYILVPLVAPRDMDAAFVESGAFTSVLTVLRALAANDERIIEYFRARNSGGNSANKIVEIDVDQKFADVITLPEFAAKIDTKIWSRLAPLSWMPYDKAIEFVHKLKLRRRLDWLAYCRGEYKHLPPKPADIPAGPTNKRVYGSLFMARGGWGAWLGTGSKSSWYFQRASYDDAVRFVHTLKLKTRSEWEAYCRGERPDLPHKPANILAYPGAQYAEFKTRGGMTAWLGAPAQVWMSYEDAVKFVRDLRLRSGAEWTTYCRGDRLDLPPRPANIPRTPSTVYKEVFLAKGGWRGWLGTGEQYGAAKYRPYDEAVKFVHTLNLTTGDEWQSYTQGKLKALPSKPVDIPTTPRTAYADQFLDKGGMAAWLGTDRKRHTWRSYDAAAEFVRGLGLKKTAEWRAYYKGERPDLPPKPSDIPAGAYEVYGKEFTDKGGMGAWLGTGRLATFNRNYRPYKEAVQFVRTLNLRNMADWQAYCKGERPDLPSKPVDIPASAPAVYRDEFIDNGGWKAWLSNA